VEVASNTTRPAAEASSSVDASGTSIHLVHRVTCPHCWHNFRPEEILWVSEHEDLMGDPVLKEEALRFLPTRFALDCLAIDARGSVCHNMACPQCHLVIPRLLLENDITFLSLTGSVGSGKSNLLASMTWQLRQQLAKQFAVTFRDGDKEANWILNRYEEVLFLPEDPDRPTTLEKTSTHGDLYRSVLINKQERQLPKPFLFAMHPAANHPRATHRRHAGTIICIYDNAGEHFGVGQDTTLTPVTQHLSKSRVLMCVFDPTQDPRFRQRCREFSKDPQITEAMQTVRQENILAEVAVRVRKHTGLSAYQRYDRPLLVLVAKSDIWSPLLDADITSEPVLLGEGGLHVVDTQRIERTSDKVRAMLLQIAPEVVTVAEDFCKTVVYIPVSALGHSPERKPDGSGLVIRPRDVKPRWVTVPILYAFAKWSLGLIRKC
jgi:hypothetical protein